MDTLGSYQILGELGRGGCGVVYSALDPRIGRKVAIKTIDAKAESAQGAPLRERFRREAHAAGILSHPHIVTIHEFDDSGEVLYIVMEYVEGKTLAARMTGPDPLPLDFTVTVLAAAADALDYAHARNIVHRDVKPANFLITPDGQLKIADFGIAKVANSDASLTHTGMVIGTAQYMSPEQISAKPVTGRSDQFSLAVIAYEMLAGKKPFEGNSWASVLHQIMSADPPPVSLYRDNLGAGVTEVLQKGLAKDPALRYESCREFVNALAHEILGTAAYAALSPSVTRTLRTAIAADVTIPLPSGSGPASVSASAPRSASASVPAPPTQGATSQGATSQGATSWIRPAIMGAGLAALVFGGWAAYHLKTEHDRPENPPVAATSSVVTPAAPAAAPEAVSPTKTTAANPPAEKPKPVEKSKQEQRAAAESSKKPAPPSAPVEIARQTPVPQAETQQTPPPAVATPVPAQNTPVQNSVPSGPPQNPSPPPVAARAPVIAQPAPVESPKPTPARPSESEAWSQVANTTDIAALDRFRQAYPNGAHFAEAQQRIEQLNRAKETAANRASISAALRRYQDAFENKDLRTLQAVWPGLGRSELNSIQNFFGIARTIRLELQPLGDPEISGDEATLRCRRILTAADSGGALPVQNQIVQIRFKKSGGAMVIQSVDVAR